MKVLYTAEAVVTGGRAGHGRTADGRLDVALSVPRAMGGDGGPGTRPPISRMRRMLRTCWITAGGTGGGPAGGATPELVAVDGGCGGGVAF